MKLTKILAGVMAVVLSVSGMMTAMPMTAHAAGLGISVSNANVSAINGETTTVTVSLQGYTKSDFDIEYLMSAPGIVAITKGNKDLINKTITLNITGIRTGATGVVVYLSNNTSTYTTFLITSKNKVVVVPKDDDDEDDDDDDDETSEKFGDIKVKYDTYVYGDNDEQAKIKYVNVDEVDGKDMVTAYVKVKNNGHKDKDRYFKARFYDKNDKLISTKYNYQPDMEDDDYIFLWWEIPDKTKTIKFER